MPGKVLLNEDLTATNLAVLTERLNWLKGSFSTRDSNVAKLRDYYSGDRLLSELEGEGLKLVANEIKRIVDTYVDFMAMPADFQVPPPFESPEGRNMADKIEKLLYSQWERNYQGILTQEMNFNIIAFGGTPIYIHPARQDEIDMGQYIRIIVPKPEGFYPVLDGGRRFVYSEVFYVEKKKNIDIRREFNNYTLPGSDYDETELVYYWSKNYYTVFYNQVMLKKIRHNWGIVPWIFIPNRAFPAELLSGGETDHAIALVKYMNELLSDLGDIVDYYANPTVIGQGTGMNRKDWQMGGYNEIRTGGTVQFLEWKGQSQIEITNLYSSVKSLVEDMTGRTSMPQSSGARGAKQVLAQMMPFDVRLNSKRLVESEGLAALNKYLLRLLEKIYGGTELKLRGTKKGQSFSMNMKANQIHGYYDNNIMWAPGPIDYNQRIVRSLQLVNSGIMSKYTAREMLGISSPQDEEKRVQSEKLQDLQNQLMLTGKMEAGKAKIIEQQKRTASEAELVGGAEQASDVEGGGRAVPGRPVEGPPAAEAPPTETPPTQEPAPTEQIPAVPEAGAPAAEGVTPITLNEVTAAFSKIRRLRGDVYLHGGLVLDGQTTNDIDILLSDMLDKKTIIDMLPQYYGRMNFTKLAKGESPKGNFIKINVRSKGANAA
jgi:hypothetical protein